MTDADFTFEDGAATHEGRVRDHNEDRFLRKPRSGVWVVADGMGGHEAGDFASEAIVDSITSIGLASSAEDLQARFVDRISRAHTIIQDRSRELNGATVGATVVGLLIYKAGFACIWAGDSRIYRMREGRLSQVTVDHTEAQELLASGAITAEQAENWPRKNVITRAIGVSESPNLEEKYGNLEIGDTFLLCSDGLTEHIEDAEIEAILNEHGAQKSCEVLVDMTLERGARDNVTIVVVRCVPQTQKKAMAEATVPPTDIDWSIGN